MMSRVTKPTLSSQNKVQLKATTQKKPLSATNGKETTTYQKTFSFMKQKFVWRVNEESGYFELGETSAGDDLYIFNTTLVSSENFHLLRGEEREKSNRESYFWTVEYAAFGCSIASDPFQLSNEKENWRTFIGDKATARIRSSGANFHNYLSKTSLKFQVLRATGVNGRPQLVGISFADLKPLTKSDVKGLKVTLEIVAQGQLGSSSESIQHKPELRVVVELNVIPNYFASADESRENVITSAEFKGPNNTEDIENEDRKTQGTEIEINPVQTSLPSPVPAPTLVQIIDTEVQEPKETPPDIKKSYQSDIVIHSEAHKALAIMDVLDEIKKSCSEREKLMDSSDLNNHVQRSSSKGPSERGDEANNTSEQKAEELKVTQSPVPKGYSPPPVVKCATEIPEEKVKSHYENCVLPKVEPDIIPCGTYVIRIELEQLWVRSKSPLRTDFSLSFAYPPLGIFRENPVHCRAKRDPTIFVSGDVNRRCAVIYDGAWEMIVVFNKLSDALLVDPIIVEIKPITVIDGPPLFLAVAKIPFGKIFFMDPNPNGVREFGENIEVLRVRNKIGYLRYRLRLEPKFEVVGNEPLATSGAMDSPRPSNDDIGDCPDGLVMSRTGRVIELPVEKNLIQKTRNDIGNWTGVEIEKFKEELKEKERSYLKILSEEWTKRDEEREERAGQVIREYQIRQQKLDTKERIIQEKETYLMKREREVEDFVSRTTFEHNQLQEETKLRARREKNQYQAEFDLFMEKQESRDVEIQRLNGKILTLESKLRAKDIEIEELNATRTKWPDISLERKVIHLEEKNSSLKQELDRITRERDNYRTEAQSLARRQNQIISERDAQLWRDNEDLRTQIFMTQEMNDIREDKASVKEMSNQIAALKDVYSKRQGYDGNISTSPDKIHKIRQEYSDSSLPSQQNSENRYKTYLSPTRISRMSRVQIESQIHRLVKERDRYVATGTYNRNDQVIRDMDNALTRLASDPVMQCS